MPEKPKTFRPNGAPTKQQKDRWRGSAASRGYDAQWRKFRKAWLDANPLCVECRKAGRDTLATDVDHIVPHRGDMELFWQEGNHQSLCGRCHKAKSARGL